MKYFLLVISDKWQFHCIPDNLLKTYSSKIIENNFDLYVKFHKLNKTGEAIIQDMGAEKRDFLPANEIEELGESTSDIFFS